MFSFVPTTYLQYLGLSLPLFKSKWLVSQFSGEGRKWQQGAKLLRWRERTWLSKRPLEARMKWLVFGGTAKAFDPPLIAKSISQNVTRETRYDDDL